MVLLAFAAVASAAQVSGVRVTHRGAAFDVRMRLALAAPAGAVFKALQDYRAMPRYNPDLRAVRIRPAPALGGVRLDIRARVCVLWLCRALRQDEIMRAQPSSQGGTLRAQLVPGAGDFRGGHAQWTVAPCPLARSCVDVRLVLVPAFWVPPLIGPWAIRHMLVQEARRTARGIEQVAQRLAARAPRR